jgi:hypothetical protein
VIGNQIFESGRHGVKHTTFAISISQSSWSMCTIERLYKMYKLFQWYNAPCT